MHAGCACLWNPHSRILDSDREWCDLANLVWVESECRCGDRITTDVRYFISSLPPRPSPCCRRYAGLKHRTRPPLLLSPGCRLWRGDSRIGTGHAAHNMTISSALPTTCGSRTGRSGITHKRLVTTWNKDCLCWLVGLNPKPFGCNRPVPQAVSVLCRCTNPTVSKRTHTIHSSGSA